VHAAALHLLPVLAAEKSKTPFYIAGGVLVAWALIVSLGLGLRDPRFPGSLTGQRIVSAITAVLVLGAMSTAVLTSGGSTEQAGAASAAPGAQTAPAGTPSPTAPSAQTAPATPSPAPSGTPAPTKLKLAANPAGQLSFDAKRLNTHAGKVTIELTNASPIEHNVTIAQGATVLGGTQTFTGGSKSVTLTLKPGTYTFYCSVPGHRQAGMEGTLNVS
jgi:plastocyanin